MIALHVYQGLVKVLPLTTGREERPRKASSRGKDTRVKHGVSGLFMEPMTFR